ncbi:MAG: FixH family protein [Betaproteobacteria bacterium]|nr:FixH family protein [Betaproteobacteria bacterium]
MNLLITIFGGMLLTALLYGLGRKLRLSNFWAAVTAAALPSFSYVIYAVSHWSGLDVLTMHVIAFPTVAVLLFQLYGDKGGQFQGVHWAPKLMIAFFVLLTIVFGGFVYIAGQGLPPALARMLLPGIEGKNIHTGFSGVVAHGEEAAKGIGHHLRMEHTLSKLGWKLEVSGLDALRTGEVRPVRLNISTTQGEPVRGVNARLGLGRPGQTPQYTHPLKESGTGDYRAQIALAAGGAWLATLILEQGEERIVLERRVGGE